MTQPPPNDLAAERAVLSAMLASPAAIEEVSEVVLHTDFYRPAHQDLFYAMVVMWAQGIPVDALTVADYLDHDGGWRSLGGRHTGTLYLADLTGERIGSPGAAYHARIIVDRSVKRRIEEAGTRLVQGAQSPGADPADLLELLTEETRQVERALTAAGGGEAAELGTAEAFLARGDAARQPAVIPGLVDREDRVVVVAAGGQGKSTLLRSVAVMGAAGLHPFLLTKIPPVRSLIIDLENTRAQLREGLAGLLRVGQACAAWAPGRVNVWSQPGGIDLRRAAGQRMLTSLVAKVHPDLLLVGPVYKLVKADPDRQEAAHAAITDWCDATRGRFGCAIWLEHHAPWDRGRWGKNLRPFGTSLWERWPEFGITLVPAAGKAPDGSLDVGRFRKDRPKGRLWPTRLDRNLLPGLHWPWLASYPDGTLTPPLEEET